MAQTRVRYHFIHNVFANFFKDMLDYFSTTLYPRFEYRVVGTYDKAVEYLQKQCQYDRETDKPLFPALILNPTGEFLPADAIAGGKQLWRYPNLAPTFVKRLFDPIYRDENIIIHAAFIRIKGEMELLMLLNSFYEYCDLRMLFIDYFGGLDRIIYPQFFHSFIIIPEEFKKYSYSNEYSGLTYSIDWSQINGTDKLVRSTARNELVVPLNVKPQISMTNLGDGSNKYGGADKMADWRLTATINYEIEIPNFLVLESDYLAKYIDLEIRAESTYSAYPKFQPPLSRIQIASEIEWGLDETSVTQLVLDPEDTTAVVTYEGLYDFKIRYFHIVTDSEEQSTTNVDINLPETITDLKTLLINSKYGEMSYGDHYILTNNGNTLTIKVDNVNLEKGMIIEILVYTRVD